MRIAAALATAAGALAVASSTAAVHGVTTPTQSGAVNPAALPLGGEPYVSTSPRVGYVDSCRTSFTGGGAEAAGP